MACRNDRNDSHIWNRIARKYFVYIPQYFLQGNNYLQILSFMFKLSSDKVAYLPFTFSLKS